MHVMSPAYTLINYRLMGVGETTGRITTVFRNEVTQLVTHRFHKILFQEYDIHRANSSARYLLRGVTAMGGF